MEGWIKLHRLLQNWEWWHDDKMLRVFLTILMNVNHVDGRWQGHEVKKGQWITGRKKLVEMTGVSDQSIRTILKRLENSEEITIKSTSKFSVITVINWHIYQSTEKESTSTLTNDQPATNQQLTTNKNEKKVKKETCEEIIAHLNLKTGKSYKATTDATQQAVNGRLKDGYTLDDFKKVINSKSAEWKDTEYEKFLRPSTLFQPSKFEDYLQNATETTDKYDWV